MTAEEVADMWRKVTDYFRTHLSQRGEEFKSLCRRCQDPAQNAALLQGLAQNPGWIKLLGGFAFAAIVEAEACIENGE